MTQFFDRGQTKDGRDIQIALRSAREPLVVTVDTPEGELITVECRTFMEAEEAAKWMEQYTSAELPQRLQEEGRAMTEMSQWQQFIPPSQNKPELLAVWLDTEHNSDDLPRCSVEGCASCASVLWGHYENEDAEQGEHSKFGGWFYCLHHYELMARIK